MSPACPPTKFTKHSLSHQVVTTPCVQEAIYFERPLWAVDGAFAKSFLLVKQMGFAGLLHPGHQGSSHERDTLSSLAMSYKIVGPDKSAGRGWTVTRALAKRGRHCFREHSRGRFLQRGQQSRGRKVWSQPGPGLRKSAPSGEPQPAVGRQ